MKAKCYFVLSFVCTILPLVTSKEKSHCEGLLYPFNTWCTRLNRWAKRWENAWQTTANVMRHKTIFQGSKRDQRQDRSTKSLQACEIKNCNRCSTKSTCTKCKPPFSLQHLKQKKKTICVHRCLWGYEKRKLKNGSGICLTKENKGGCTTVHCFRCRSGYYQVNLGFLKKRCVTSCPLGYVKDKRRKACYKHHWRAKSKLRHGYPT